MARRRNIGGGASAILQAYINDSLMRGRQSEENAALMQRQKMTNDMNFAQNLLPGIREGKYPVRAFSPEINQLISQYFDPTQMAPSLEQRAGKVATDYLGKSKFEEIPDEQGILQAFEAAGISGDEFEDPVVVNALNAVKARQESLRGFIPNTPISGYNPETKQDYTTFKPNNQLAGMTVQTKPTPTQAGENQLSQAMAGELNPAMTGAKVAQTNTLNRGTQASEAAKAGAVSGAQAMAANSDAVNNQKFDLFSREEAIRQQNAVGLKQTPGAQDMSGGDMAPQLLLQRVKALNERLPDQNIIGRIGTAVGSFTGTNTDAADLDNAATAGGMIVARMLQKNGPVSDADAKAGGLFFPKSWQPLEYRNRMVSRLDDLVNLQAIIAQMYGTNVSLSQRPDVIKGLWQLMDQNDRKRGLSPLPTPDQIGGNQSQPTPTDPRIGNIEVR